MLTFEQIKELVELVAKRHLQGLEIEKSGFRVKIDGQRSETAMTLVPAGEGAQAMPAAPGAAPAGASPPSAAEPEAEEPGEPEVPEDAHVVTSPIVGTFYRAPAPEADPYVEVGGRVKKGQVLCIVEAMKLMNEIESDVDGTIHQIYPKNAQPVEFGEALFAIRPS